MKQFEIITVDGSRFRFRNPDYRWQYALVQGTIDQQDMTVVEVFSEEEEGEVLIKTFSQVIAAGYVTDETAMMMPREKRMTECPRCGFVEPVEKPR